MHWFQLNVLVETWQILFTIKKCSRIETNTKNQELIVTENWLSFMFNFNHKKSEKWGIICINFFERMSLPLSKNLSFFWSVLNADLSESRIESLWASALHKLVFPVPGGPCSNTTLKYPEKSQKENFKTKWNEILKNKIKTRVNFNYCQKKKRRRRTPKQMLDLVAVFLP